MQNLIYDQSEARLESTDGPPEESEDEKIDLSREESKSEGDQELEEADEVPCDSEELSKKDEEDLEYGEEIPDDSVEEDSGCDEKLKEAEAEMAPLPRSNSFTKFTEPENIEKDISETILKQVRKRPKSEYRIKRTNQLKRPKTEVKASEDKPQIENEMEDIRKHLKTIQCIKGEFKGVTYKINKQSKFIANSDNINLALNRAVNAQIKKDSQAHGTYSMNSFAIYPKHLKNTIQTLFQTNSQNLMPNLKKFENAFTDQTQQESNIYKDMKLQMLEESKKKRRFMTSIRLEKSFHLKSTFEIWFLLHSK